MQFTDAEDIRIETMAVIEFDAWRHEHPRRKVVSVQYQIKYTHVKPPSKGEAFTSPNGSVTVMLANPDKAHEIISQEMVMVVWRY